MHEWVTAIKCKIISIINQENLNSEREPEWLRYFTQKVLVKSGDIYKAIQVSDIIYLQAHSNYTIILTSQEKVLSCKTLKYWQDKITSYNFIRLHNSFLVNKLFIQSIDSSNNLVMMHNGSKIPVSKTLKSIVKTLEHKTA